MTNGEIYLAWSKHVAELAVYGLLHAKLIQTEHGDLAVEIVAEEINVRLQLGDRPDSTNWRFSAREQ